MRKNPLAKFLKNGVLNFENKSPGQFFTLAWQSLGKIAENRLFWTCKVAQIRPKWSKSTFFQKLPKTTQILLQESLRGQNRCWEGYFGPRRPKNYT